MEIFYQFLRFKKYFRLDKFYSALHLCRKPLSLCINAIPKHLICKMLNINHPVKGKQQISSLFCRLKSNLSQVQLSKLILIISYFIIILLFLVKNVLSQEVIFLFHSFVSLKCVHAIFFSHFLIFP